MDLIHKMKVVKKISIPITGTERFAFSFYIYLADYGYTPYKVGMIANGNPKHSLSTDFWLEHFTKPDAIDYVESTDSVSGLDVNFWFAYEPGVGLKVFPLSSLRVYDANQIYNKVIKEGEVLLTEPEFNIHKRLQQLYFNNKKEIEWD